MKDTSSSSMRLKHAYSTHHHDKVEKDLYMKMKELESELEILNIQEDYLKDE